MKGEINCDYYCALGRDKRKQKKICHNECASCNCEAYHRKWPTLEQFRTEYEAEYPDDGAVYFGLSFLGSFSWSTGTCEEAKNSSMTLYIVCACSPWGKPKDNWRP